MTSITSIIAGLAAPVMNIIDQAVPDKDKAAEIKREIQLRMIEQQDAQLQSQVQVVLGEITGQSWLQRNWRPMLMMVIVAIVANNYIIAPYLDAMFGSSLMLELPERLWDLMTLGVGGYVAGRTGERLMTTYQQGKVEQKRVEAGVYQNVDAK